MISFLIGLLPAGPIWNIIKFILQNILWFILIGAILYGAFTLNNINASHIKDQAAIAAAAKQHDQDVQYEKDLKDAINKMKQDQNNINTINNAANSIDQAQINVEGKIHNVIVKESAPPFSDPGLLSRVGIMRLYQEGHAPS